MNRPQKADRVISAPLLERRSGQIADWWEQAYLRGGDILARRFGREATAALPVDVEAGCTLGVGQVLEALSAKRLMQGHAATP